MPDSTENFLTDEEVEEADALSTEQLVSKLEEGLPASLARRPPPRITQSRTRSTTDGFQLVGVGVTFSGTHVSEVNVSVSGYPDALPVSEQERQDEETGHLAAGIPPASWAEREPPAVDRCGQPEG